MNKKIISILIIALLSLSINLLILKKDKVLMGDGDSHLYFLLSKNLFEGKGYTIFGEPHFHYTPLPPILTAFFFKLFGVSEFVAALPSILFSLLTVILCYVFINFLTDGKVAFLGTLLLILHFDFVYLSTILRADIIYMFFLYLFIFFILKGLIENKNIFFYFAAISAAIANLSKYIMGPLFFLTLFYLLYKQKKKALNLVLFMLLIFFIIQSPWFYRNYYYHGNPFFTQYNSVLGMYNNPADVTLYGSHKARDEYVQSGFKGVTFKLLFSKLFFKKIFINTASSLTYFLPKAIGLLVLFLAMLYILTNNYQDLKKQEFLMLIIFYTIVLSIVTLPVLKMFTFISPIFLMWAVQGYFKIFRVMLKDNLLRYFIGLILILLILHSYIFTLLPTLVGNRVTSRFETQPVEGKEVGFWIKQNIPKNASMLTMRIDVSSYGDIKYYEIPFGNLNDIKKYAKLKGIQYLVYDDRYAFYQRPELRLLLNEDLKEGLELIYKYKNQNQVYGEVYIWKFV